MNSRKIMTELEKLLEASFKEQHKHQEILKYYLKKFKAKKQELHKKLEKEIKKTNRKKLKGDLGMIKKGCKTLGAKIAPT